MKKSNDRTILQAFARLSQNKDEIIRAGMYGILEDAVQTALEAHNDMHQMHIEIGDTYGWMLVHNGRIEEIVVEANSDNRGNASRQLREQLGKLPKKGWVGVVMAGMQPASYFSIRYELGTLEYAKNITLVNFFQYFKQI